MCLDETHCSDDNALFSNEVEEANEITNRQKVMKEEKNLTHAKRERETKERLKNHTRKRKYFCFHKRKYNKEEEEKGREL